MIAHIYPSVLQALAVRGRTGRLEGDCRGIGAGLCRILDMNFYEKALFVKPTWRPVSWLGATAVCPSRYASIRTLRELTRSLVARYIG
jgi:hypothetical protein